jgi:sugar O-acyltransferase (sialic acid O-acetyltransferase NeuD family)
MSKKLILVGSGGHARVVLDAALCLQHTIHGIIDLNFKLENEFILGVPVIGGVDLLSQINHDEYLFALAIGDNQEREQLITDLNNLNCEVISLVHPTAILSSQELSIGIATFIGPGAIINAGANIGAGTIINTGAVVEHECKIGDFVHVAPNASIAGRVTVGKGTFIGLGSCVIDKISIGKNVVIGANSTITKNVSDNQKVGGVNKVIS